MVKRLAPRLLCYIPSINLSQMEPQTEEPQLDPRSLIWLMAVFSVLGRQTQNAQEVLGHTGVPAVQLAQGPF